MASKRVGGLQIAFGRRVRYKGLNQSLVKQRGEEAGPTILAAWFFDESIAGKVKVWDGATWNLKPVKVWDGATWNLKPVKVWDGASWVLN